MTKQAQGGRARAEKLSPEERSAIAQQGATARWANVKDAIDLPKETHQGELVIGDNVIPCSVLENGMRVFSQRAILRAMGSASRGGQNLRSSEDSGGGQLPGFLANKTIRPYLGNDLLVALSTPILFRPKHRGRPAFGYEATLLPGICAAILDARRDDALKPNQLPLAFMAESLLKAFAQVGIIALVDEATGYQAERERDELQTLLKAYLSEEALKWVRTFPQEFFSQVYRLRGWKRPLALNAHTPMMGKMINSLVYERLPEGVMEQLKKQNPVIENGYRKHKHHQFLTEDVGHPHLRSHLQKVIGLMQASLSWEEFKKLFGRVFFPQAGTQPELGLDE